MSCTLSRVLIGFPGKVDVETYSPPKLKGAGTRYEPELVDTLTGWDPSVTLVSGDIRTVLVPSE
jgi:hypothetical protein